VYPTTRPAIWQFPLVLFRNLVGQIIDLCGLVSHFIQRPRLGRLVLPSRRVAKSFRPLVQFGRHLIFPAFVGLDVHLFLGRRRVVFLRRGFRRRLSGRRRRDEGIDAQNIIYLIDFKYVSLFYAHDAARDIEFDFLVFFPVSGRQKPAAVIEMNGEEAVIGNEFALFHRGHSSCRRFPYAGRGCRCGFRP